jgi:hypothetical protein
VQYFWYFVAFFVFTYFSILLEHYTLPFSGSVICYTSTQPPFRDFITDFYHSEEFKKLRRFVKKVLLYLYPLVQAWKAVVRWGMPTCVSLVFFSIDIIVDQRRVVKWLTTIWINLLSLIFLFNHPSWLTFVFSVTLLCWTSYVTVSEVIEYRKQKVQRRVVSFCAKLVRTIKLLENCSGKLDTIVRLACVYEQFTPQELRWVVQGIEHVVRHGFTRTWVAASDIPEEKPVPMNISLEDFCERWAKLRNIPKSNVYKALKRFGSYVLALGLTDVLGAQFHEGVFIKHLKEKGHSLVKEQEPEMLILDIIDTTITFVKTCHGLILGESIEEVLAHQDDVLSFITEYERLMEAYAARRENSDNLKELADKFKALAEKGRRLKAGSLSSRITAILKSAGDVHRSLLVTLANTGARKLPFGVLLYGPSGVGKSSITNYVFQLYLKHSKDAGYNPDIEEWKDSRDKYTRNHTSKYWDEYDGHWALVLDDIAQETAAVLQKGQGSSIDEVIQVMNNVPFATNQAEIGKKGAVPLLARCVVGTTNIKHLNAHAIFATPSAVHRRFPLVVTIEVKDQYREPGTSQLKTGMNHTDSWNFCVEKVQVVNGVTQYVKQHPTDWIGMEEFQDIMKVEVVAHEKAQANYMDRVNAQVMFAECGHIENTCNCGFTPLPVESIGEDYMSSKGSVASDYVVHGCVCDEPIDLCKCFVNMEAASGETEERALPWYHNCKSHFLWMIGDYSGSIRCKMAEYRCYQNSAMVAVIIAALFAARHLIVSRKEEFDFEPAATKENIWAKTTNCLLDELPLASKSIKAEDLVRNIDRNIFWIEVSAPGYKHVQRALGVRGRTLVTNWHLFEQIKGEIFDITVYSGNQDQPLKDKSHFKLKRSELVAHPTKDLVFITHPDLREVRDITKYLADSLPQKFSGSYYTRNEGWQNIDQGMKTTARFAPALDNYSLGDRGIFHARVNLPVEDAMGTCGGPLAGVIQGASILVGISCALDSISNKVVGFIHITKADVDSCVPLMHSAGDLNYLATGMGLQSLHGKSLFRHETNDGRAMVVGSFSGHRTSPKTRTMSSPIANLVPTSWGENQKYAAPKMKGELVGDVWMDPYLIGLQKRIGTESCHDMDLLEDVVESLVNDLAGDIDIEKLHPTDIRTALNGADGVPYVDALDKSTSGGFRFPGPKNKYLIEQDDGKFLPNSEVLHWYDYIKHKYLQYERANVLFDAKLKDEALPLEKVEAYKTRVFTSSALDFSLVVREQFVYLCAQLMENGLKTGIAGGMNAYTQWTNVYDILNKFGTVETRCAAGDYSGFDTGMSPQRIRAGMEVLIRLNKLSGNFSEDDEKLMLGITSDIAHPYVNFNGDVLMLFGTNCSGHPLTLILNSIVNLIDIRYCYVKATGKRPEEFRSDVSVFVMGDDNIFTVREGVNFGHTTLQTELAKLGIKYTMADKKSESREYLSIKEVDFLKRSFRFDDEHPGVCIPALDKASIRKMLTTYTVSRSVSTEQQMGSILTSAAREAALHGRSFYAEFQTFLKEVTIWHPKYIPWMAKHATWDYDKHFRYIVYGESPEEESTDVACEEVETNFVAASGENLYGERYYIVRRLDRILMPYYPDALTRVRAIVAAIEPSLQFDCFVVMLRSELRRNNYGIDTLLRLIVRGPIFIVQSFLFWTYITIAFASNEFARWNTTPRYVSIFMVFVDLVYLYTIDPNEHVYANICLVAPSLAVIVWYFVTALRA